MTQPTKKIATLAVAITMVMAGMTTAGELRPLDLPSEREPYRQEPRPPDAAATVYDRFREKIDRLKAPEKAKVLQDFKNKLKVATSKEDWKAAAHYQTLIDMIPQPAP